MHMATETNEKNRHTHEKKIEKKIYFQAFYIYSLDQAKNVLNVIKSQH